MGPHLAISWNDVSSLQADDVTRHELLDEQVAPLAVAQAVTCWRGQRLHGRGGGSMREYAVVIGGLKRRGNRSSDLRQW